MLTDEAESGLCGCSGTHIRTDLYIPASLCLTWQSKTGKYASPICIWIKHMVGLDSHQRCQVVQRASWTKSRLPCQSEKVNIAKIMPTLLFASSGCKFHL